MKNPILYSYIIAKLDGQKEIHVKEFRQLLTYKIRIRDEMWLELLREMILLGLVRGYEDKRHVILLKSLSKSEKKRLAQIFPMEFGL